MKPLSYIIPEKDTSLLLIQACLAAGHRAYYLPQQQMSLTPNGALFHCTPLDYCSQTNRLLTQNPVTLHESDVSVIFIRTDPPFDDAYLHDMWLLEQLPTRIRCINSAHGIRTVNEKIWTTQFKDLIPPTWVTASKSMIVTLLQTHQTLIIKPTNHFGGHGIFKLEHNQDNTQAIIELLTNYGQKTVIVQTYLEQAKEGDKRILLLDGNPIGAVLRQHNNCDHRNNFMAGGIPYQTTITPKEHALIHCIKPQLIQHGLRFVGIDCIGETLIEINVTSPTCLQEINSLSNSALEHTIVETLIAPSQ